MGPPLDSRISQCSRCGCSPPYCLTMVAKRPAAGRNEAYGDKQSSWCLVVVSSKTCIDLCKFCQVRVEIVAHCCDKERKVHRPYEICKVEKPAFGVPVPPKVQGFGHSFLSLKWHMSLQLLLKLAVVSLMRSLYVLRVLVVAGPDKHCSSVLDTWRWPQFRFDVDFSHLLLIM